MKNSVLTKALTLGLCGAMALSAGVPAFAAVGDVHRQADVNVFIEGTGRDDPMNVTDPSYTDVTYGSVMLLTFKTQADNAGKIESSKLNIRNNTVSNNYNAKFSIAPQEITVTVPGNSENALGSVTTEQKTYALVEDASVNAASDEYKVALHGHVNLLKDDSSLVAQNMLDGTQNNEAFGSDGVGAGFYELVTGKNYQFTIDGLHDRTAETKNGTFQQAPFALTIYLMKGAEKGVAVDGKEDVFIEKNQDGYTSEDSSKEGNFVNDAGSVLGKDSTTEVGTIPGQN